MNMQVPYFISKGMNQLGSESGSGLDPDSVRSVDPDSGLQQDQHCRHHEHAGTYLSSKAWKWSVKRSYVECTPFWSSSAPFFAFQDPDFFQTIKSSNHFSYKTADFAMEISIKLLSHLQDFEKENNECSVER